MQMIRILALAIASVFVQSSAFATIITQDFSSDPQQGGWKIFGDTELFEWDSANGNLKVTWDSSKPNSYFHHPLGTIVSRHDDFTIEFDLQLADAVSGHEPGKTGPMQLAIGLLNLADATSTNFMRGVYYPISAPMGAVNVVEFNHFPAGYYDFGGRFDVDPTIVPTFISREGYYAPTVLEPYKFDLPTNLTVRVTMNYTASNQTLTATLATNGVLFVELPDVVLTNAGNSAITGADDFRVNAFSITSYSSAGNDFDSLLAHGTVDNVTVAVPPPPVQDLIGAFTNGTWQAEFVARSNWVYTLECTENFQAWQDASPSTPGVDGTMFLSATNAPADNAFYRVRAWRP